ncbi:hypothetical protein GII33_03250 [Gordonia pseudamarae]|jgi:hypothetical protein|uniref:Uncharacterized protein n=1 Tax=Gordonia pseudamarae TaxID=2831662 RepID=A0ABX6IE39_9ACTN|nr:MULTISPECIES: hypothetical protein [Gordonia]MBD0021581.1 hypothetical protein [Gordonia sp. (in: high G+C Gram-positive bacteria)]QHN25136.1 hypothetical protein GII33_03250 [Gordonia pseudamarae]QHN34069.1 hypothetical protein GII31_03245 [Gordonia pseudamarae]
MASPEITSASGEQFQAVRARVWRLLVMLGALVGVVVCLLLILSSAT